jgi:hypothetical protein
MRRKSALNAAETLARARIEVLAGWRAGYAPCLLSVISGVDAPLGARLDAYRALKLSLSADGSVSPMFWGSAALRTAEHMDAAFRAAIASVTP